jgi:hypothetical protein
LVSYTQGGTKAEGVQEQGGEEDIWVYERQGDQGMEKTT